MTNFPTNDVSYFNELDNQGITVDLASLNDGVWYNHDPSAWTVAESPLNEAGNESRGSAIVQNDEFAQYSFDLGASPGGYDVTQIDLFSNWGTGNGRNEIRVNIFFSLVATPTVFDQSLTLGGDDLFQYQIAGGSSVDDTQHKLSITGIDATGVAGVRFQFPSQENSGVGYSELDVIGSAVPEPTTSLLAGLGMLALLRRRRN